MNIVGIIQARIGSTRLHGKVLLPIAGTPLLSVLIKRVLPTTGVNQWVVATSDAQADLKICALAETLGVACFRGSESDCLDRYFHAATHFKADVVIRLTADNPLVDSLHVSTILQEYLRRQPIVDYVCSGRTFPLGLAAEVFSFEALSIAWKSDLNPRSREHVTPYLYTKGSPFRLHTVESDADYGMYRWTVDTEADLQLVTLVFEQIGCLDFPWTQALGLCACHPEWLALNQDIPQKSFSPEREDGGNSRVKDSSSLCASGKSDPSGD